MQALPPSTGAPLPLDRLLDGLALLITDGHAAAAPILQRAAGELTGISLDEVLRWGWMATFASSLVWDIESFHTISARHVQLVRNAGAVAQLPLYLWQLAHDSMWAGDLPGAASLAAESDSIGAATGSPFAPYTLLRLRALQGTEAEFSAVLDSTSELVAVRGQGISTSRHWAAAVLWNGLGRYEEAAGAARAAASDEVTRRPAMWVLPELVEAASRSGNSGLAARSPRAPCSSDATVRHRLRPGGGSALPRIVE